MQKRRVTELGRLDVEAFHKAEKMPLTVVLDNVRSFHNVGAVFRTADAYRVERIVLCGMTAQPPAPEIHKTALGAEDAVAWTYEADTLEAVRKLKDEGYKVFAIEQAHGSTPLQNLGSVVREGEKFAVVFGHEVKGVQQEVVDAADGCLELPQFGTKHSLNVSVTAGIVIWEFAQKMMSFSPLQ